MPTFALLIWPLVAIAAFRVASVPVAILVTVIGGYLFLPPGFGFDFPVLPSYDKVNMPALVALVLAAMALSARRPPAVRPGWLPTDWVGRVLIMLLFVSAIATPLTNMDSPVGPTGPLRPLGAYDAGAGVLRVLMWLLPFFVARKFLSGPGDARVILVGFAVFGLIYSLLALYEVRMSPQLNRMVYGYFPHSWVQHLRGGGFRPLVFLNHGLWLGIFFCMATLAAFGCWRSDSSRTRARWLIAGVWLVMTLVLARSLGALMIFAVLLPLVLFARPKMQLLVAAVVGVMIVTYPALRGGGLVPIEAVSTFAERINPDRAASFRFRLQSEDLILARANEIPLFGWGIFGRSVVQDEFGGNISVNDGYWTIAIGQGGWARYATEFGLLAGAIVLLAWRTRKSQVDPATAALALVMTANLVDLIPNATLTPMTWLLAGALWGRLEAIREADASSDPVPDRAEPGRRASRTYSRSPNATPSSRRSEGEGPRFTRFSPGMKTEK